MFVPGWPYQPNLMSSGQEGAYLIKEHLGAPRVVFLALTTKIGLSCIGWQETNSLAYYEDY